MEELQDVKRAVQEIKQDIKEIKLEMKSLEMRTTGNEKDIININKHLDKISANTTWILRLVVGGIIGAIFTFLLKGNGINRTIINEY
ncbi:hemolysin XhlA family protein [Bacillus sp. FSL K6-0268]|uniref:hemolysin XhlA family protein n=1 Tax=Bacillus sp. FSL K6-0268 TaxID=2921449 RepID=UPI0030FC65C3